MIKIKIPKKLTSRKFLLAAVGGIVVFANGAYDLGLDIREILTMAGLIITYIWGESKVDVARARNGNDRSVTYDSPDDPISGTIKGK